MKKKKKKKSNIYKVPKRFRVTKRVLWLDHFMNHFIVVGGVAVIAAVMGIFVFIFFQILPLFQGAKVKLLAEHQLVSSMSEVIAVDLDEWAELPVVIRNDGSLRYLDLKGDRGVLENNQVFRSGESITTLNYNSLKRLLVAGSESGKFAFSKLGYRSNFGENSVRTIHPDIESSDWFALSETNEPIRFVDYGEGDSNKMAAGITIDSTGKQRIRVVTLAQKKSLFGGGGKITIGKRFDLTPYIDHEIQQVDVSSNGDLILITATTGEVFLFVFEAGDLRLRQRFWPFENLEDKQVQRANFLMGDVSVVFSGIGGENRIFSLSLNSEKGQRLYSMTKEFEILPESSVDYYPGVRNKSFLLLGKNHASLRYSTTESIRWEKDFDFEIARGVIGEKYDRLALLDTSGILHLFSLNDPHPQAGLKAYFGQIWYEGQPEADYIWQSTGGTDDFEPKLSLVPLIFGSLKGTFYAMLFAVPIALLAALYTSQFLEPRLKGFVKPTMEIMASLPSVVLGFMAALWLAPLVDTHVPSFLLLVTGVPLFTFFFGWGWLKLPKQVRLKIPAGLEFLLIAPFLLIVCYVCWNMGPIFERMFFVVTNPDTGEQIADFRLWWPDFTGATYTQRNSLIVGFMMGFAVIPIIFTIAEDSMSNVPVAMRSGSLALGASRWQTAVKIVLPTASAGILSSLMIGFGRAVGETMIVVMATGNTPIKDFNIFSGMRTLSANIAVELPEAPYHGTLYRTLFLGALVLFVMTFLINTVAEILRQELRNRYKTVE